MLITFMHSSNSIKASFFYADDLFIVSTSSEGIFSVALIVLTSCIEYIGGLVVLLAIDHDI